MTAARARFTVIVRLALALAGTSIMAACADDGPAPPKELVDGTPARVMTIELDGAREPVIATVARRRSPAAGTCAAEGRAGDVVERIGVTGSSITALSRAQLTAYACDSTKRAPTCGMAFARLREGHALDPRLSLTCRDADGATVAFAWIEPSPETAYLVVSHAAFAEAYPVLGRVPVRVWTEEVDLEASTARFEVSEHTRSGGLLRRYVLQPRVAG